MHPDVGIADGDEIAVGSLRLRCLHVPGHCADHLTLYEPAWRLLITGDLLFVGKVGGTSSDEDGRTEWSSLQRLLASVPDDATVWPGHDYGVRPSSTIALERATNPFLRCADVDAFLALKRDWAKVKLELGTQVETTNNDQRLTSPTLRRCDGNRLEPRGGPGCRPSG